MTYWGVLPKNSPLYIFLNGCGANISVYLIADFQQAVNQVIELP